METRAEQLERLFKTQADRVSHKNVTCVVFVSVWDWVLSFLP